jgi:hypothetical protein
MTAYAQSAITPYAEDVDALMAATFEAFRIMGEDTDGDSHWHCTPKEAAKYFVGYAKGWRMYQDNTDRANHQFSAEVERLRAALDLIHDAASEEHFIRSADSCKYEIRNIARAALGQP